MSITTNAEIASFGGRFLKLTHQSEVVKCPMNFNLFLPGSSSSSSPAPLLIYLSGLTCTPDNASEKGFIHAHAAAHGIAVLYPDTSPRGSDHPGENDSYDFGSAASFYIYATREPWSSNYRMETYLTGELPGVVFGHFAELDPARVSIMGHSMGGHGALTLYMKHPGKYRSVSALAPVSNPTQSPWGEKIFTGYLGDGDKEGWKKHDATELVKGWKGPFNGLVDVGTEDNFYKAKQLLVDNFESAAKAAGVEGVTVRYQKGYDHSYYFVSSFGKDHVEHAAKFLK